VVNIEHWTSGTDQGSDGNFMWCGNKLFLNKKDVNWKSGQPKSADGHCIFISFSEKSANQTFYSMGDCMQKRNFVCEVIVPTQNILYCDCDIGCCINIICNVEILLLIYHAYEYRKVGHYQRVNSCRRSA
jgi:hypothetical protein